MHIPNNIPATPVKLNNNITEKLSPLFSVSKKNPTNIITSAHCIKTITD